MARLTIAHFNDIQQDHLDELISGYLVRRTRSFNHLKHYLESTRQPFFACEGVLRLTQSIVNQLPTDLMMGPREVNQTYQDFFVRLSIPPYELVNKLLHLFESVISFEPDNLRTLRNVCLVSAIVGGIYEEKDYSLEVDTLEKFLKLLIYIVTQCEHTETVLYAVNALDNWLRRRKTSECSDTNHGISDELTQALAPLCTFMEENQQTIYDLPIHETTRFSLSFTARWLLSHYQLSLNSPHIEHSIVKLSSCGLIAGSSHMDYKQYSVRSAYPVHSMSGIFYYEVILLTSGNVAVGWATREERFSDYPNCTPYSLMLERNTGQFYHKSSKYQSPPVWVEWLSGDVMGCLIDVNERRFAFYLNGREVECPLKKIRFSSQPYYAAVQLGEQSCCYFNFGQLPFKHTPELAANREWSSFHQITNGKAETYCLLQPHKFSRKFWFKQPTISLENDLFYSPDAAQDGFNLWAVQLQSALAANLPETDQTFVDLKSDIKEMLKEAGSNNALRLAQALIEMSAADESLVNSETQMEALFTWANEWAFRAADDYLSSNIEFMHVYIQLPATNARRRSFFAFYSIVDALLYLAFEVRDMFRAFIQAVLEQENKWTLKIAHRCLSPLTNKNTYDERYFNNVANVRELQLQVVRIAEKFTSELNAETIYDYSSIKMERFRLGFKAQTVLRLLSTTLPSAEIADTDDCLEFSEDGFAVADCGREQATTQSGFKCVDATTRSYYYEAILLSSGNITVGWASRSRGFNRDNGVGSDPRSIGFSATRKTIYNDAITPIEEMVDAKEGDVVGCLLDGRHQRFAFYLNGERVQMPENIHYFAQYSYFAAATLTAGQMCYFNFGQLPFKYAPEGVENLTSFHAATGGNVGRYRLIGINIAG